MCNGKTNFPVTFMHWDFPKALVMVYAHMQCQSYGLGRPVRTLQMGVAQCVT